VKRTLWWTLLVLAVLAIGYLGVGLVVAERLSAPSHQPQKLTPTEAGLDYRQVKIQSTDRLELAGWWVPGNDPARAVVLVSGIEGDKSDRHVVETAPVYAGAGYGVLMIDLRAQGSSEGERVTMGYKEVRDVRGALLWLNERGFAPGEVVLHGFSLGGATVLRAAPQSGVAAVVEESAYSDLPLILRQQLPEVSGLPSFFTPGIFVMSKLFLGIDPWAVRPERDARKLCEEGIPLLIIHSTDDETMPFEHARRIKAACPEATLWRIEGYEHVGAYAHPEYRQSILDFLRTKVFTGETRRRSQPSAHPYLRERGTVQRYERQRQQGTSRLRLGASQAHTGEEGLLAEEEDLARGDIPETGFVMVRESASITDHRTLETISANVPGNGRVAHRRLP
jgi:uncharacterized protein